MLPSSGISGMNKPAPGILIKEISGERKLPARKLCRLLYDGTLYSGPVMGSHNFLMRTGFGTCITPDGTKYKGEWHKNIPVGEIDVKYPDGQVGKILYSESGSGRVRDITPKYPNKPALNNAIRIIDIKSMEVDEKGEFLDVTFIERKSEKQELVSIKVHIFKKPAAEREEIVYSDRSSYAGTVVEGKRSGTGTYTRPDGTSYTGKWTNDYPHGRVVIGFPDGTKAEVRFHKGFHLDRNVKVTTSTGEEIIGAQKGDGLYY